MTSWFISVEASVISGGLLYSKGIRFLFPVGKRLVLAARRPYIERGSGSNPCRGNKKAAGIRQSLFYSMVGRQGFGPAARATAAALSRLARCAGKRSRVSSAPRPFGFEPVSRQQKSDQPKSIAFFSMVGRQGFSLLRRRPLRRFRALRAALANAHAFTQLRAPTGSNPCRGNKKATNRSRSLSFLWWAVRGSNPGPWD